MNTTAACLPLTTRRWVGVAVSAICATAAWVLPAPPARAQAPELSPQARQVARWAVYTGDAHGMPFAILDKPNATLYVFGPGGTPRGASPVLLGSAIGDDAVDGIGERAIADIKPSERTTPAGRFVSMPGRNASGEDIVWVDYGLAISMHRVRPLVKAERRLERLASPTPRDNRISYGCINLPPAFYNQVVHPLLGHARGIVYILPETRSASVQFGAFDVPDGQAVAGDLPAASQGAR